MAIPSPAPKLQFFDANGEPLVGGKLYSYLAGTTTPQATYTSASGLVANANPIILDSRGEANVWLGSASYKLKLTTSTDVEIWTVDNIDATSILTSLSAANGSSLVGFTRSETGADATTVQAKLREVLSVKDFGATGDGVTDDTTAIQDALNAGIGMNVYFPAGTYLVSSTLVVKTQTTMSGDGAGKSILKLTAGTAASTNLLRNDVVTGTANVYYDTDIYLRDLTFDGNSNSTRTAELVAILKVMNVTIENCAIQNNTFIGAAITASRNVNVTGCEFYNNGRPIPSTVSGPALWVDTTAQGTPYDVRVSNCFFRDNNWSAAYFMPVRGAFTNNICVNNGESTVFTNQNGQYIRYENNTISGTTISNISGSGIETGGAYLVISGNTIDSCAASGISLTDTQNVVISDNHIFNNSQNSATDRGISIITSAASPGQPDHISINNNRIGDRQGTKTQYAAVGITVSGSGAAVTNLAIHNNDFTEQKTATYDFPAGSFGAGSYTVDNYDKDGALLPPFRYAQFQLSGSTGAQSITGIGFRPRAIKFTAVLASTIQNYLSFGSHDGTSGTTVYFANDASGRRSGTGFGVIDLKDSAGVQIAYATLASLDQDGFTINVGTANVSVICNVECYP